MTTAITGAGAAGGGAAAVTAVQTQVKAAAPAPPKTADDSVTISAAARELPQPVSVQVRSLHNQGRSVAQIATTLKLSPSAVQSYLGTPAAAAKR